MKSAVKLQQNLLTLGRKPVRSLNQGRFDIVSSFGKFNSRVQIEGAMTRGLVMAGLFRGD
jgi:hypothetical protein